MADISTSSSSRPNLWRHIDTVWLGLGLAVLGLFIFLPTEAPALFDQALGSFTNTAPFILFAILLIAFLKATGAENLLAKAFTGSVHRMIILGALAGGLSPFCSCEVIPFIAALLAAGAPLAAVMAFWLASPLMDPAMFTITSGALGVDFAVAKTVSAIGMGLLGGYGVVLLSGTGFFADPLKATPVSSCGCGAKKPFSGAPVWQFWQEADRRETFGRAALENALFLGKWLALAYLIEALMIRYVPADWIAQVLGGEGLGTIILAALVGAPAYLNGYAAVPLISGLIEQGMSQGAALAFMLGGGVSSIPAMIAVWALVKPRVFASYLFFAFTGAVMAGLIWGLIT